MARSEVALLIYRTVWSIISKLHVVKNCSRKNIAFDLFLPVVKIFKKKITKVLDFCFPQKTSCIIKCYVIIRMKRKPFYIHCSIWDFIMHVKCISRTELQSRVLNTASWSTLLDL